MDASRVRSAEVTDLVGSLGQSSHGGGDGGLSDGVIAEQPLLQRGACDDEVGVPGVQLEVGAGARDEWDERAELARGHNGTRDSRRERKNNGLEVGVLGLFRPQVADRRRLIPLQNSLNDDGDARDFDVPRVREPLTRKWDGWGPRVFDKAPSVGSSETSKVCSALMSKISTLELVSK